MFLYTVCELTSPCINIQKWVNTSMYLYPVCISIQYAIVSSMYLLYIQYVFVWVSCVSCTLRFPNSSLSAHQQTRRSSSRPIDHSDAQTDRPQSMLPAGDDQTRGSVLVLCDVCKERTRRRWFDQSTSAADLILLLLEMNPTWAWEKQQISTGVIRTGQVSDLVTKPSVAAGNDRQWWSVSEIKSDWRKHTGWCLWWRNV